MSNKFLHHPVFEAYLKRFAPLQDYLGSKVFPLNLEAKGIGVGKMSQVLSLIEKEGLIELDSWLKIRQLRNTLEHEYPNELPDALKDLTAALEHSTTLLAIVQNIHTFLEQKS